MRIEHEILEYLIGHPDAKDTLEGIVEWWLMEERIRTATIEVQAALAELTARGFLTVTTMPDGRSCYEFNRVKEEECRRWLMEGGQENSGR